MDRGSAGKASLPFDADLADIAKAALVVVGALLCTWPELEQRVPAALDALVHGKNLLGAAGLAVTWIVAIAACLITAFAAPLYLRLLLGALFCASSVFVTAYGLAMSESLQTAQFERMTAEFRFLSEGVSQFQSSFNLALLYSVPLTAGLLLPSKQRRRLAHRTARLTLLGCAGFCISMLLVVVQCWAHGGSGVEGYPAFIRPAAYWSAIALDDAVGSGSARHIPAQGSASASDALDNIVLVVDESVVADEFGSDPGLRINPQLGVLAKYTISFGAATSGANCSAASNLLLQVGARLAHAKDDLASYPWLWEYAKKAGYTITYIDMQQTSDVLHNGMTDAEHALIDHVIVARPGLVANNDRFAGEQLAQLLRAPHRNFVYINKVGAHFPYDSKYPAAAAMYKPVLGIAGNPFRAHAQGQPAGWATAVEHNAGTIAFKNSYRNAVEWNFNSFFSSLQDEHWLRHGMLIYTSDHGQNIFRERGRNNTHCSSGTEAAPSEGRVPLLFITAMPSWSAVLTEAAQRNQGRESHFNLFDTLIGFMGFPTDSQEDPRDPPVWASFSPADNFSRTYTEIHTRFGARPQWMTLCPSPARLQFDGKCAALN